jgi:hypothetical protein
MARGGAKPISGFGGGRGGRGGGEEDDGAPTRVLTMRFAAHLARLLDGEAAPVIVSPIRVRALLTFTLSKLNYSERLVGFPTMVLETSRGDAAERWLEGVLDRRQQLARALDRHKAHELFEPLCRRGHAAGWAAARLARGDAPSGGTADKATPADWPAVAERLARLDPSITQGNPAEGTRARLGPLGLEAGGGRSEVIEELSVWQAMTCGPLRLGATATKEEQRQFYSRVTKALEAAAAHWSALIALGLWPPDWQDAVSVNTAKKLAAFLAEVRRQSAGFHDRLETWERAWAERQVPGHASARALFESPVGQAIRRGRRALVELEPETFADPEAVDEARVLDDIELEQRLALAVAKGVIDALEAALVERLSLGETLADLAARADVQARLGAEGDLQTWLSNVAARIARTAREEEP